ncbi:MAG: glutamine amidotransferase [Actinomycetes bacterium]
MTHPRLLLIGESWVTYMIHQKGFDSFTNSEYVEDGTAFKAALRERGWEVTHLPSHRIEADFPAPDELAAYDVVVISDVGANSFHLTRTVFAKSQTLPDKLAILRDYVANGGGLIMVGGYLSFSGVDAKGHYAHTAIAPVLPVEVLETDDRQECPAGAVPQVQAADHPAIQGVAGPWPALLGFNRTVPKAGAEVLVTVEGHPLIAVGEHGKGRSAVFTSDMAPHWAPEPFVSWEGYGAMWHALCSWTAGR